LRAELACHAIFAKVLALWSDSLKQFTIVRNVLGSNTLVHESF